jgi:3-methyladenine DNA glycosylase AlkD
MRRTADDEVGEIRRRLRARADPRVARLVRSARGCSCRFHGVIPPEVRAVARRVVRRHRRDRGLGPVLAVAEALWKSPYHEERSAAIHALASLARRLENRHWDLFRRWILETTCLHHCDGVAVELLGTLVKRDRAWLHVLRHWSRSSSPWVRRASVTALLPRTRQMGDAEAALEACEGLMRDPSPRVQAAVAALLREALEADAALARDFLDRWRGKARRPILAGVPARPRPFFFR